jgi:hypothetical protein
MNFATRLAAMTLAAMMLAVLTCWTVPVSAQQAAPPPDLPPQQRQPSPNT